MAEGPIFGHQEVKGGEFQWMDGELATDTFHLLREGYLNMSLEEKSGCLEGRRHSDQNGFTQSSPAASSLRRSTSLTIKGWKRRWCVLSKTDHSGTNLLYYRQQSSVESGEPPVGVLLMEDCRQLYTMPCHARSANTFAIDFPFKTMLLYPENSAELERWLVAFQRALGLRDDTPRSLSELKGLPKQKAIRKDNLFQTMRSKPTDEVTHRRQSSGGHSGTLPRRLDSIEEKIAQKNVKFVSYRVVS